MITVIIAGGSGSRLWPLSTPDYPKHLLKLTNDRSLIQNTYDRAALLSKDVYVVTEASHAQHVKDQLPELTAEHIIVEPGRRGTASCVIAALARIKSRHDATEPIVFMHADHHIRDTRAFIDALNVAGHYATHHQKIVLLGLEPTHPATGYGYIQRGERANGRRVYDVLCFEEKPDRPTAEKYLAQGNYLWNMGYFVAPLEVFERNLETYAPTLWQNYQKLLGAQDEADHTERYLSFVSEPIDTALIERVKELLVTPGTFDWVDVGSFPEMHAINSQDEEGNTIEGYAAAESVTNSLIRNDTDVPVAVIGLDNVVVVNTPEGLLVANKNYAQKVGDLSKQFRS